MRFSAWAYLTRLFFGALWPPLRHEWGMPDLNAKLGFGENSFSPLYFAAPQ
jgi:hypothetical protein